MDLGRATGQTGYFLGVPILYGLLLAVLRFRFLSSGYGDAPVAFMAFADVYALLLARSTGEPALRTKYVLLGAVLCAGAALTKQAGLYIAAVYPILAWSLVGPNFFKSPIQAPPLPPGEGWGEGNLKRGREPKSGISTGVPSPRPSPGGRWGPFARALGNLQESHCDSPRPAKSPPWCSCSPS